MGIEAELPKIPQETSSATNGATTLPSSSSHDRQGYSQESPVLDLSDVVGDFEATLKRSTRSTKTFDKPDQTDNGQSKLPLFLSFCKSHVSFRASLVTLAFHVQASFVSPFVSLDSFDYEKIKIITTAWRAFDRR